MDWILDRLHTTFITPSYNILQYPYDFTAISPTSSIHTENTEIFIKFCTIFILIFGDHFFFLLNT